MHIYIMYCMLQPHLGCTDHFGMFWRVSTGKFRECWTPLNLLVNNGSVVYRVHFRASSTPIHLAG